MSQDRSSQDRSSQDMLSQDRSSQVSLSQDRLSQNRSSKDRSSQDRSGQVHLRMEFDSGVGPTCLICIWCALKIQILKSQMWSIRIADTNKT